MCVSDVVSWLFLPAERKDLSMCKDNLKWRLLGREVIAEPH